MRDNSKNKKPYKIKRTRDPKIHLILQNDNVNDVQYIHDLLVNTCAMNPIAAEQAIIIAHTKGKCPILTGPSTVLYTVYAILHKAGLTVTLTDKI